MYIVYLHWGHLLGKIKSILHIPPLLKNTVFVFAKLCSINPIQVVLLHTAKVSAKARTREPTHEIHVHRDGWGDGYGFATKV